MVAQCIRSQSLLFSNNITETNHHDYCLVQKDKAWRKYDLSLLPGACSHIWTWKLTQFDLLGHSFVDIMQYAFLPILHDLIIVGVENNIWFVLFVCS